MNFHDSTWREISVGDLGGVITGRTPPSERPSYFGEIYPFVTPGDMHQGKYVRQTERNLSDEGAALLKRNKLPANSICVSCIGWQMGEVIVTDRPSFTNQQINAILLYDGYDPSFVYYSFRTRKRELLSLGSAAGARTPILNKSAFCNLKIRVPSISMQRQIASILGAYDDLIEVNRRRIAVLEEMARRLFEEWFVHFRFPGHENQAMVETPDGPLPKGWVVTQLGDVLNALEAGARPKGGIKDGEGEVPSIGAENINGLGNYDFVKEKLIPREFFSTMRRGHIQGGEVLLYKDGAHIGRISMFKDGYPYAECAINEHVFLLRPQSPITSAYLYFWLEQSWINAKIRGLNSNAAQPGINQPGVKSLPILRPAAPIAVRYAELVEPMLVLLFRVAIANRRLALSRDLLLPRLISGELSVATAERELEAVA